MAPPIHRYELSLQVLLENLQELRSTGLLQTQITGLTIKGRQINEACRVELALEKGAVRQCTIFHQNGDLLLQGNEAWLTLRSRATQRHAWQFSQGGSIEASPARYPATPSTPVLSRETPAPVAPQGKYGVVPRLLPSTTAATLQQLSREYRRILTLVDGQRSVQQIAALLSLSPEYIHLVLHQCRSWQLVAYEGV
jgi:hypothetical protein